MRCSNKQFNNYSPDKSDIDPDSDVALWKKHYLLLITSRAVEFSPYYFAKVVRFQILHLKILERNRDVQVSLGHRMTMTLWRVFFVFSLFVACIKATQGKCNRRLRFFCKSVIKNFSAYTQVQAKGPKNCCKSMIKIHGPFLIFPMLDLKIWGRGYARPCFRKQILHSSILRTSRLRWFPLLARKMITFLQMLESFLPSKKTLGPPFMETLC